MYLCTVTKKKWFCQAQIALCCVMWSSITFAQPMDSRISVKPLQPWMFKVDPEWQHSNETAVSQLARPETIEPLRRASWLGFQGDGKITVDEFEPVVKDLMSNFELSAREPYIEENGFLIFLAPKRVDPKLGVLFDAGNHGHAKLNLLVESGHRYLATFVVSSSGAGKYRTELDSMERQFDDIKGEIVHINVPVEAASSGWIQIDLQRYFGTEYYLHYVDVTVSNSVLTQ